jgi:hypothetical protein
VKNLLERLRSSYRSCHSERSEESHEIVEIILQVIYSERSEESAFDFILMYVRGKILLSRDDADATSEFSDALSE